MMILKLLRRRRIQQVFYTVTDNPLFTAASLKSKDDFSVGFKRPMEAAKFSSTASKVSVPDPMLRDDLTQQLRDFSAHLQELFPPKRKRGRPKKQLYLQQEIQPSHGMVTRSAKSLSVDF